MLTTYFGYAVSYEKLRTGNLYPEQEYCVLICCHQGILHAQIVLVCLTNRQPVFKVLYGM